MASNNIAIVGAGLSGLTAALRLAKKGYSVTIFEQNPIPGGKAGLWQSAGFSFDTGPSLLTMRFVLDELFENLELKLDNFFEFIPLSVLCKYFYHDNSCITAYSNSELFALEIEKQTKDISQNVTKLLQYSANLYNLSADFFLLNELKYSRLLSPKFFYSISNWPIQDVYKTFSQVVDKHVQDSKTRNIFYRYATYNGSSAFISPSLFLSIAHVEHNLQAWIVKGGIYEIPKVLAQIATNFGVKFNYNSNVEKIVTNKQKVTGLKIKNQILPFENIIYTGDYWNLTTLLPSVKLKKPKTQDLSTSAILFYWGVQGLHPELDLHNIFFSENYKKESQEIWSNQIPTDPTIYVNITSKILPDTAPKGAENWFVMINVPPDSGQNWSEISQNIKSQIISKIKKVTGIDLSDKIIVEKIVTPTDLASNTQAFRGSLYGLNSNSLFRTLRPNSRFPKFKNLYLAGGTVYPGGGMPLAILSGKFAADNFEIKY